MPKTEHFEQMFSKELKNIAKFSLLQTNGPGFEKEDVLTRLFNASCDAIKMRGIIENHLKKYGITLNKDIVACALDGDVVNVKKCD